MKTLEKGVKFVNNINNKVTNIGTTDIIDGGRSGIFIVSFEQVSLLFLLFLSVTLNR